MRLYENFAPAKPNQVGSLRLAKTRLSAVEVGYYKFDGSGPEKMNAATLPRPVLVETGEPACGGERTVNCEFEFLLACCSDKLHTDGQRHGRPADTFGWDRMLQLTEHHRVGPNVCAVLNTDPARIPSKIRDALRLRAFTNARQALLLTTELVRILSRLEAAGVEALAYKGPVLAHLLYADVTARQFGDLDLLIRKPDLARAKAALLELEYSPYLNLNSKQEKAHLASGYEWTFDSERGRNLVELKWQLLPRFYSVTFEIDAIFERAIRVEVNGASVLTLCPEDLFLVLCVHAAKHAWSHLSLLTDIANLAKTQALDWAIIHHRAFALGIERILAVNILLSNQLLGTSLPATIAIDHQATRLANRIALMLAAGESYNTESLSYFAFMLRLRERGADRVRFLFRLVFTPTAGEWSAIRLPDWLFPLYSLVRIFRLVRRFGANALSSH